MKNKYSIGVFDSGLGGISILNELIKIMPNENYIYFADTINSPFGNKNFDTIKQICVNIVLKLLEYDVKLIVIACGTATTQVIDELKVLFPMVHFVGFYPNFEHIFEPKMLLSNKTFSYSKNENLSITANSTKLLIIATSATCKSKYVKKIYKQYKNIIDIYIEPADFIVKYIENNFTNTFAFNNDLNDLLKEYKNTNYLVLGCTHFPLIYNHLKKLLPTTTIINNSKQTAILSKDYINNNNIQNDEKNPYIKFINTSNSEKTKNLFEEYIKNTTHKLIHINNF